MILSPFSFLYGMRSKKGEKNAFWYVEFFFFSVRIVGYIKMF